jgi:hypothetical protein
MEVDVAVLREIEHPLGDDASVGDDEDGFGADVFELLAKLRVVLDLLRLHDGEVVLERYALYGRGLQLHAATCCAVRLGDDEGDLVAGGEDGLEGWYGELGCSAED